MRLLPVPTPQPSRCQPGDRTRQYRSVVILTVVFAGSLVAACAERGTDEAPPGSDAAGIASRPELPAPGTGFVDVTLAAGIDVAHRLPGDELGSIVDAVGAGAAFADLDGDGWLDLIVLGGPRSPLARSGADHAGVRLYRNLADGHFEDRTADSGLPADMTAVAVTVGDVDGDGDRDLYFVDRGPNRLFVNDGGSGFSEAHDAGVGDGGFGVAASFFDLEGDGDLDLFVANYLDYDPRQTAHFAPEGFPGPLAYRAEADVLYRNRGDGTFEDVSAESGITAMIGRGMSVAAADLDEDGDTDLFVANDATENFLWLNDGSGSFVDNGLFAGVAMGEGGEQTSAMATDLGDVNGDGRLDLAVSDTAFGALYLGYAPGLFVDEVMRSGIGQLCGQYVSWGQNLLDYDNDGDSDLFIVNGGMHHLVGWEDLLLRNDGGGRFEDAGDDGGAHFQHARTVGRGSIVGDYDNDGDIDLFVTTLAGPPYLLRNDVAGESWITLALRTSAGADALGARVRIEAGGRSQLAQSYARTTYLGQSDPRLHFGLGAGVDRVDRVEITWRDGSQTLLLDLPARQIVEVREGS
jgi:hypothetical protein